MRLITDFSLIYSLLYHYPQVTFYGFKLREDSETYFEAFSNRTWECRETLISKAVLSIARARAWLTTACSTQAPWLHRSAYECDSSELRGWIRPSNGRVTRDRENLDGSMKNTRETGRRA